MKRIYLIALVALILIIGGAYIAYTLARPLPPTDTGAPVSVFDRLFPFGNTSQVNGPGPGGNTSSEEPAGTAGPVARLRHVTDKPVSGMYLSGRSMASTTLRYIERETGHVYETLANASTITRVSNTTIPAIEEVLWASASEFVIRYLATDGIQNFRATLAATTTEQSLSGSFLGSWARGVIDQSGKNLLTVTETPSGSSVALMKPDGSGKKTILSSPLRSWVPLQAGSTSYLATAPASGVPGSLYRVALGELVRVAGPLPGLIALPSPSGRYLLTSGGSTNSLSLSVTDTKTGAAHDLPVATIASKCVWISENPASIVCGVPNTVPPGAYPDAWLLGEVALSDMLWQINVTDNTAVLVSDLARESGSAIDVWQPTSDPTGSFVAFLNKNDLSLWLLSLISR